MTSSLADEAEASVMRRLAARDFRTASLTVATFEASKPKARGIGIDWKHYDPDRDRIPLEAIFSHEPGILKGVRPDALEVLRVAAGMMYLWGVGTPRRSWLPFHFDNGSRFDGDVAARMLVFYADSQRNTYSIGVAVAESVKILGCSDSSRCAACAAIDGNEYPVAGVPEIPFPDCTSPKGCRCCVTAGHVSFR
jgi:hypothetical protein